MHVPTKLTEHRLVDSQTFNEPAARDCNELKLHFPFQLCCSTNILINKINQKLRLGPYNENIIECTAVRRLFLHHEYSPIGQDAGSRNDCHNQCPYLVLLSTD